MQIERKIFNSYRDAFDIRKGEVISLVGGGGKTTLMFAIARELSSYQRLVVTTTTTRIFEPPPSQTQALFLNPDEDAIINWLRQNTGNYSHVTVANKKLSSGKITGINTDTIFKISKLEQVIATIVEADGALSKPLKAPNATEPVISENTSLVIPVVGIDALGQPLSQDYVFRPKIASALIGLPIGEIVTSESIAVLLTHNQGIAKGSPSHAKIIPFINKVMNETFCQKAIEIAERILSMEHPSITRVVIGQAAVPNTSLNVVFPKTIRSN